MDSFLSLIIGIAIGHFLGWIVLILFGNPFEYLEEKIQDFRYKRRCKKYLLEREKEYKQAEIEEAKKPLPYEWRDL